MSNVLPYFKFVVTEYLLGDITKCSYAAQGVWNHVKSHYWRRDGKITLTWVKEKLKNADKELEELIQNDIFKVDQNTDFIRIDFLNEQVAELLSTSDFFSKKGREGAAKRWGNGEAIPPLCKEEEKKEEDKRKKNTNIKGLLLLYPSFDLFWDLYDKKVERGSCEKKWVKLTLEEKELIFQNLPLYVKNTPEKKFRKNPETYLNGKCWLDEVIILNNNQNGNVKNTGNNKVIEAGKSSGTL